MAPKRLILFLLLALLFLAWSQKPDNDFHLIFCDVGQGDAILLKHKNNQVLIDAGPDDSVLSCLSDNLPFWDRKLELVILTHPDADHFSGLAEVFKRYQVSEFISVPLGQKNDLLFENLLSALSEQKIIPLFLTSGDKIRVGLIDFDILWPSKNKLRELETFKNLSFSQNGFWLLNESLVNNNEYSLVSRVSFGQFDILLTGDLSGLLSQTLTWQKKLPKVEILKAAHHGSAADNPEELYLATEPKLVAISVGKNKFGHPGKKLLESLKEKGIKIKRTDEDGEVEIISDGQKWWLEN